MRILPRMILATAALGCFVLLPEAAVAQQERSYDYWQHQREMIKEASKPFLCVMACLPLSAQLSRCTKGNWLFS